ncbi:hypothetical protein ACH40F_29130 [Streptomyces sp. NPDC020794]|uniref:hypothetical protein n=1 Tax=unclassified Streptomyces TaxID=2593676 RepID=UPI0036F0D6AD
MNAAKLAAEAAERGDVAGQRYWLHVEQVVNSAPPLSPEQVSKLRVLIWSDVEPSATAA